jgi:hypothetical protein
LASLSGRPRPDARASSRSLAAAPEIGRIELKASSARKRRRADGPAEPAEIIDLDSGEMLNS